MANKTTDQIVTAFRLINNAKLTKMETAERFALIKAMRQLKKVATEFDDFLKDAQDKLKPENFDTIMEKYQSKQELTSEEIVAFNKYNKNVSDCLKDELDKEIELTFEPLTEESLGRLIESNDYTVNDIMVIEDVLGA